MRTAVLVTFLLTTTLACHPSRPSPARQPQARSPATAPAPPDWPGVYCTPSEIGDFSGTVLVIERDYRGDLEYDMSFYSDVEMSDTVRQSELTGKPVADGDRLYLPQAHGFYSDGKPYLWASLDRFTRQTINGHVVLMRDDALKAYREQNKLYDYGLLIRVADSLPVGTKLSEVKHPSVKVLYADPTKPWKDPFVHGPNAR